MVPRENRQVAPVALDLGVVAPKLGLGDAVALEDRAETHQIPDVLELGLDLALLPLLVESRAADGDVQCLVRSSPFRIEQSLSA